MEFKTSPKERARSLAYYRANRERIRIRRKTHPLPGPSAAVRRKSLLKNKYGLTPEAVKAILETQCFCCAICHTTDPGRSGWSWQVDHDHNTGRVRGLLCLSCNTGLGQFKDSKVRLASAISYLERGGNNG